MKMIQIRNVPDEVHRKVKARAAMEGKTLSDYALAELVRSVDRPTMRELRERIEALDPVTVTESSADAVRAERDAR